MALIPERFKIKVTQSDTDSMNGPLWSERMIEILLGFWRWVLILMCALLALVASTVLGFIYFLVVGVLVFAFVRRVSAVTWLRQNLTERSNRRSAHHPIER